jgi:hypothetical protein
MLPEHIASHMANDVSLFSTAESYETVKKKSKYIYIYIYIYMQKKPLAGETVCWPIEKETVNILNKHSRTLPWNLLMEHQIAITHFASSI